MLCWKLTQVHRPGLLSGQGEANDLNLTCAGWRECYTALRTYNRRCAGKGIELVAVILREWRLYRPLNGLGSRVDAVDEVLPRCGIRGAGKPATTLFHDAGMAAPREGERPLDRFQVRRADR